MKIMVLVEGEELIAASCLRENLVTHATSRHLGVNMAPLSQGEPVHTGDGFVEIREVEYI